MEDPQKLFDSLDDIEGKKVPVGGEPCEVCKNPNYLGKTDVYYEYNYCANCGRVLSNPVGDRLEDYDDYDDYE